MEPSGMEVLAYNESVVWDAIAFRDREDKIHIYCPIPKDLDFSELDFSNLTFDQRCK